MAVAHGLCTTDGCGGPHGGNSNFGEIQISGPISPDLSPPHPSPAHLHKLQAIPGLGPELAPPPNHTHAHLHKLCVGLGREDRVLFKLWPQQRQIQLVYLHMHAAATGHRADQHSACSSAPGHPACSSALCHSACSSALRHSACSS